MCKRVNIPIIFILIIGITAHRLNAQIVIPKKNDIKLKVESLLSNDTIRLKDSISVLAHYEPLLKSTQQTDVAIYQALVANKYTLLADEITPSALELYKNSIQTAKLTKNDAVLLWVTINYIEKLYHYGKVNMLTPVLLDAVELVKNTDAKTVINPCKTFMQLGWMMQTFNDLEEAHKYLTTALGFAKKHPNAQANILNALGSIYFQKSNYVIAENYFDQAFEKAKVGKDYSRMAKALGDKGRLLYERGELQEAIALIKEDLYYSDLANDNKNTMFASILLAKYELANNNKVAAKKALHQAEKIATTKSYYNISELEIIKLKLLLLDNNQPIEELRLRRQLEDLEQKINLTDGQNNIVKLNWHLQKQKFQSKLDLEKEAHKYQSNLLVIFILIISSLLIYAIFWFIKYKKRQNNHNINVQESERERIASDLHDNIINKLTIIRLKTALKSDPEEIDLLLEDAIDDSRRMSHNLLPPTVEHEDLEMLIEQQISNWSAHFSINYHYENPNNIRFDTQLKLHLIRIIQEVLQNIYKHAQATIINIELIINEKDLDITIKDNGIGYDTQAINKGIGLRNIHSRAHYISATYQFVSHLGQGTSFSLQYMY